MENQTQNNEEQVKQEQKFDFTAELQKVGNAILNRLNKKVDDVLLTISDSLKAEIYRTSSEELNKFLEIFKKAVEK